MRVIHEVMQELFPVASIFRSFTFASIVFRTRICSTSCSSVVNDFTVVICNNHDIL